MVCGKHELLKYLLDCGTKVRSSTDWFIRAYVRIGTKVQLYPFCFYHDHRLFVVIRRSRSYHENDVLTKLFTNLHCLNLVRASLEFECRHQKRKSWKRTVWFISGVTVGPTNADQPVRWYTQQDLPGTPSPKSHSSREI